MKFQSQHSIFKKLGVLSITTALFSVFYGWNSNDNSYALNTLSAPKKDGILVCQVLPPIIQGFLTHHVNFKKLEPELESRTIEQFISKLDPSKSFFFETDVVNLKTKLKGVFKKLGSDCSVIDEVQALLTERIAETVANAKEILSKSDFKFDDNVEIIIDPKQRHNPKDKKMSRDHTYKLIQFQISNYLATEMKLPEAKKQLEHRYELSIKRQKDVTKDELYGIFLDAFASSLDAHSGFLGRDTLEDFEISMRLSLEGIGAALTWEDGYTVIDNLIPGGSAEKSGELQPKDKIIAVGQNTSGDFENVIDMPLRDVVKLIRGKKGSQVRLSVLRQNGADTKRLVVLLTRDKISLQDEAARLVYKNVKEGNKNLKVALIDLPSFYGDLAKGTRSCYDDMKKLVIQAKKEKADGIILDLSRNGGGLLSEAVKIGGLFIKQGNIVATQDSQNRVELLADEDGQIEWNGPLVILTSRLSASASEIVAGAMKDYHRALIVGSDHTFGKGTVQAMMNLPRDLGAIKVTTGMFFVPGGKSTQYKGVDADVTLPSIFSTKDLGESSLDYSLQPKAISAFLSPDTGIMSSQAVSAQEIGEHNLENVLKTPQNIKPFATSDSRKNNKNISWTPVSNDLVNKLRTLSMARVDKDTDFKKVKTDLAEVESSKGVLNLAKSMKKQKEENDKDKKDKKDKKTAKRGKRKSDEEYFKLPEVKESINVIVDMIKLSDPTTKNGDKNHEKTASN